MSKTANKQTAVANAVLATFRLIVRGNTADGKRVRRCKNVMAADPEHAAELGEAMAEEVAKGLENIYFNVYPPVGELCNGGLSKGFEMVDGLVVKTGKTPTSTKPAPDVAAAAPAPAPVKPARVRKPKVKAAPATIVVADAVADAVVNAPANDEETAQQAA